MYAILIKEKGNLFRFLSVKKEIMKETTTQVTDPDTQEVKDEVSFVGTGTYETVKFETNSRDELEAKCVELLGSYNKNEFLAVNLEPYQMDLVWNSETEEETV